LINKKYHRSFSLKKKKKGDEEEERGTKEGGGLWRSRSLVGTTITK
jgi:hypothetical protein